MSLRLFLCGDVMTGRQQPRPSIIRQSSGTRPIAAAIVAELKEESHWSPTN